jgi:pimeloyl-ACP methyl ester carboxylesterase
MRSVNSDYDRLTATLEKDTLFLHGGPGLNAYVERQVLGEQLPHVHFWDQPPVHTTRDAFNTLMEVAVAEVERMFDARRGPIKLMANSFGGHLVSELLDRIPQKISACHLYGPVYDIPAAYLNLLGIMANDRTADDDIRTRITEFLEARTRSAADKSEIWNYFNLISSDACFLRYYWPDEAQYAAWITCMRSGPEFDFITFRNVLNDFLNHHYERRFSFDGAQEILIEFGDRDPLLDLEHEMRLWNHRFTTARIVLRRGSGHFIHLEPYL